MQGTITNVKERATSMFKLPEGFYNSSRRLNFCVTDDSCDVHEIRISNDGNVVVQRSSGDFGQGITITLGGIVFPID